ncbi:hypothetical protein [Desulfosporosinus nitroreducens]|nr:hypothetical protein [Desulfosporosinus nitroreducens]MCO1604464.1 hypothetical protein [Desulfosporosinus nitroreducens]
MFKGIQYLKKVNPVVRVYPGHLYGKKPSYSLSYLMQNDINFIIDKQDKS